MATDTIDELAVRYGAADPELRDALLDGDITEFGRKGALIASDRVLRDARRLAGIAAEVWEDATEAQKDALVGFGPAILAVFVGEIQALRDLSAEVYAATEADQGVRGHGGDLHALDQIDVGRGTPERSAGVPRVAPVA